MLILRFTKKSVFEMYLDYVNNYLTVRKFASDYGISENKALRVISLGRRISDRS